MAGGRRYKWQGSRVEISTEFPDTNAAITAVTAANPPVVTRTAHGLEDGDSVRVSGVVGMTELNGGTYIIQNSTANTFELANVDATGYGAYVSGGEVAIATFVNFCELTGYNRQGGTSPDIDATTICSDAIETEVGLGDYGTTTFDYNWAPSVEVQQAIEAAYASGSLVAVRVILPNGGGTKVQIGTVQQTSEQASNGGLWTGSLTIRNTGRPVFIEA